MPFFRITGIDAKGSTVTTEIEAEDESTAIVAAKLENISPTNVKQLGDRSIRLTVGGKKVSVDKGGVFVVCFSSVVIMSFIVLAFSTGWDSAPSSSSTVQQHVDSLMSDTMMDSETHKFGGASWSEFLEQAKSKVSGALTSTKGRYNVTSYRVVWDRTLEEGLVELRSFSTTSFGNEFVYEHVLNFTRTGRGWRYTGGTKQRIGELADPEPRFKGELEYEMAVIFSHAE